MQLFEYFKEMFLQMVGFYVYIGLILNMLGNFGIYFEDLGFSLICDGVKGQFIMIIGYVQDGVGMIMCDVLIESWQVDV